MYIYNILTNLNRLEILQFYFVDTPKGTFVFKAIDMQKVHISFDININIDSLHYKLHFCQLPKAQISAWYWNPNTEIIA